MQTQNKNRLEFTGISVERLQIFCLLFLGAVDFLLIAVGKLWPLGSEFFMMNYLMIPALVFLGASLTGRLSRAGVADLLLGGGTLIWIVICQYIQAQNWETMENLTLFWPIYLLVFPFASVVRDGKAQKGLKLMGMVTIAITMVMVLYSAMLAVYILPPALREIVEWDIDGRLAVLCHPNIAGNLFMIGIAFTLAFFFEVKNKWLKLLLLGAVGAQLLMQALTNSRTSTIMTCALIGGAAFFAIAGKGGWKRFLLGLLVAAWLAGSLFMASDAAYDWNHNRLSEAIATWQAEYAAALQEAEASPETAEIFDEVPINQEAYIRKRNSFSDDLTTLNGRTEIWKGAFNTLRANPQYLWRGTAQVGVTAIQGGYHLGVMHLHNSWVQMLVAFGIPGLLVSLYLTFLAFRGAFWALFAGTSSMWRRCIAMLMLCMLAAGILEPFLFTGYTFNHFTTVVAMICIGYLNHWYRLRKHPELDD